MTTKIGERKIDTREARDYGGRWSVLANGRGGERWHDKDRKERNEGTSHPR